MSTPPSDTTGPAHPGKPPRAAGWALLSPLLLWLLAFVVAPTAVLLLYSFCKSGDASPVEWTFTTEHYRAIVVPDDTFGAPPRARSLDEFLDQRVYLRILLRSVSYAALTTALCVVAGYPVAWFIAKAPPDRRNRLLVLLMIPFWTSFLIRTFAWINLLSDGGLVNAAALALTGQPLRLLYTPAAVLIGLVYTFLPFAILPIYASVEKLDDSVVEAALDLGASPVRAFARVILPLTWPGVVAGALLVFVPSIGMFAINDLLGGGKVVFVGNVVQEQFGSARNWPLGSALGMALMAVFALAFLLSARRRAIA